MDGIFVSYRRDDAAGWAGRLVADLAARFPARQIFHDIATIRPGEDFIQAIDRAIPACRTVLVLIGPGWAGAMGRTGERRLHLPDDPVRLEVKTALESPGVTVIPVLLGDAGMPAAEDLPEDLRPLLRRNAAHLSDLRWQFDVGQLAAQLANGTPATPKRAAGRPWLLAAVALLVLLVAAAVGWVMLRPVAVAKIDGRWVSEEFGRNSNQLSVREHFEFEMRGTSVVGVNWVVFRRYDETAPRTSEKFPLMDGKLERDRLLFCLHFQEGVYDPQIRDTAWQSYRQCYDGLVAGEEIRFVATNFISHPAKPPLLERFVARRAPPG